MLDQRPPTLWWSPRLAAETSTNLGGLLFESPVPGRVYVLVNGPEGLSAAMGDLPADAVRLVPETTDG